MAKEKLVRQEKRNDKDRARRRPKNTDEQPGNNLIIMNSYNFLLEVIQPY